MKQFILIVITAAFFWSCDDEAEFYNNEAVVSEDCTNGEETGMKFDSDSVRCGEKGHIYFGLGKVDEKNDFSQLNFYLFHDREATKSLDSIWILETDSVKISTCEKLKYSQKNLSGVFCLRKVDNAARRETVNLFFNPETGCLTCKYCGSNFYLPTTSKNAIIQNKLLNLNNLICIIQKKVVPLQQNFKLWKK